MFGGGSRRTAARSPSPPRQAPPRQQSGGLFGGQGLGQTMMTGMAFGAGSAVAHKAVDGIMGGGRGGHAEGGGQMAPSEGGQTSAYGGEPAYSEAQQQQENPCMTFNSALLQCMQQNTGEIGLCQNYMNDVVTCEKNYMNSL